MSASKSPWIINLIDGNYDDDNYDDNYEADNYDDNYDVILSRWKKRMYINKRLLINKNSDFIKNFKIELVFFISLSKFFSFIFKHI